MMRPIVIECPSCGAVLPPKDAENQVTCEYCDMEFLLEEAKSIHDDDGQWLDPVEIATALRDAQIEAVDEVQTYTDAMQQQADKRVIRTALVMLVLTTVAGALIFLLTGPPAEKRLAGVDSEVAWPLRQGWSLRSNYAGPVGVGTEASFVGLFQDMASDTRPAYLISFRLEDLEENWRLPVPAVRDSWYLSTFVEVVDAEIYLATSDAKLHRVDAKTGRFLRSQQLSDVSTNICRHPDGYVVVQKDEQHQLLNPETWTFSSIELDSACEETRITNQVERGQKLPAPEVEGLRFFRVFQEDDVAVAVGHKSPGTAQPMAVGFQPSSGSLLWTQPISSANPELVEAQGSGMFTVETLSNGVFYSTAKHVENKRTLIARGAQSGSLLWEVSVPDGYGAGGMHFESLEVLGDRLLLESSFNVFFFEKQTGELTGIMGGL